MKYKRDPEGGDSVMEESALLYGVADGEPVRDICERTLAFAVSSLRFHRAQFDGRDEASRVVFRQFLRASTSIGANVEEARSGESRADFIHKYAIAQKEAREALYWLRLIRMSDLASDERVAQLETECSELLAILTAILVKSKARMQSPKAQS